MYALQSRRSRIRGRRILILILVAVVVGTVGFLYFTGRIPALSVGSGVMRALGTDLPNTVCGGGGGVLYSDGSELVFLDASGSRKWTTQLDMTDITTRPGDDLILNYSGDALQVMRFTKEQLFETSIDSPILDGAAGRDYVAVLLDAPEDDDTAKQMIYVFEKGGQKTAQLSFNRQIIDFGFFSDDTISDLLWTLSLDTSGAAPMSYITMYNKDTGEMTYSITVPDRVIERVYVTSNFIYATGSGSLTAYTYFGEAQAREAVQGWKPESVLATNSSLYAAYVPRTDTPYIEGVLTFQADGGSGTASIGSARFALPMHVIEVAITASRMYAFTTDTMYVYTLGGSLEREQPLGVEVLRAKQVSDESVILWGQDESYILRLQ